LGVFGGLTAGDIMATGVIAVGEKETLASAWELLDRGDARALPVVRGDEVVGVVDDRAVVHARTTRWLDGRPRLVGDACRPVPVVTRGARLAELVARLAGTEHAVLVVCDPPGHPVGVITADRLVHAVAASLTAGHACLA
jgi:CBS-domain-containing membrane protein